MSIGDCVDVLSDVGELGHIGAMFVVVALVGIIGFLVYLQVDSNNRADNIEANCKLLSAKPLLVIEDGDERMDTRFTYLCKDGTGIQVFDKTKKGNVTFRKFE